MDKAQPDELGRLKSLKSYAILDTPPETDFDALTRMIAQICEAPIATVTLVDERRRIPPAATKVAVGYRVLFAADAAEAFEILATVKVGVIVCDQCMPGMSGTEFLSRVKSMYPDVTRMVLSGYADLQSVTGAVNHGAIFKFLTKPWLDDEMADAVRDGFGAFESKRAAHGALGHP